MRMTCLSIRRFLFISMMACIVIVWALMFFSDVLWGRQYFQASLVIMVIALPILGCMLYICVGYGLRYLQQLSDEITHRESTKLQPIKTDDAPIEVKPIVNQLNILFVNLRKALIRNKRFASDAAHELRTPLAALKTQAQVALNAHSADEQIQALKNITLGVDRCTHIIDQLLTLSRVGPEATLENCQEVNLNSLTTEIIALLVPKALEKNIELEFIPKVDHAPVYGNDIALGILIRNLVDNAIRYSLEGSLVQIFMLKEEARVILRVTDNGPGIPEELHERVFERFFRVLGTKTTGSGLGLAIVKQIATMHQATIKLATPPSGQGLQFDVIFMAGHPHISS